MNGSPRDARSSQVGTVCSAPSVGYLLRSVRALGPSICSSSSPFRSTSIPPAQCPQACPTKGHPLPFHVSWFPRSALLETPFLLPSKLLLILESPFFHLLLQEALSPQPRWRGLLPPSCWSHSGFEPEGLLVVQLWAVLLVPPPWTQLPRPGPPQLSASTTVCNPTDSLGCWDSTPCWFSPRGHRRMR